MGIKDSLMNNKEAMHDLHCATAELFRLIRLHGEPKSISDDLFYRIPKEGNNYHFRDWEISTALNTT